jgi:hypothetical protein
MGEFVNSIHVLAETETEVIEGLQALNYLPAYVTAPANGWVSVCLYYADSTHFGRGLAAHLQTAVLVIDVYDGDVCYYSLFQNGALLDEFDSDPDHWVGDHDENGEPIPPKTEAEKERLRGQPDALLPYCLPGTTRTQVEEALTYFDPFLQAGELAKLLGIPAERALNNFNFIQGRLSHGKYKAADYPLVESTLS